LFAIEGMISTEKANEYANVVGRMNDNIRDKWVELANEIDEFTKQKLVELEMFIASHNDCFFSDEDVCPCCGKKLEFGEDFLDINKVKK